VTRKGSMAEALEKDGWKRQFVACEPRLSEAVEMYEKAGYEVHLEPLPSEEVSPDEIRGEGEEGCRLCFEGFEDQYKTIFTRPRGVRADMEDDPF
jgi:hypothetical protein